MRLRIDDTTTGGRSAPQRIHDRVRLLLGSHEADIDRLDLVLSTRGGLVSCRLLAHSRPGRRLRCEVNACDAYSALSSALRQLLRRLHRRAVAV